MLVVGFLASVFAPILVNAQDTPNAINSEKSNSFLSTLPPAKARITQAVDKRNMLTLRGNTHPLAAAQFDQGPASDAQPMSRILLLLQRAPEQELALRHFLDDQQSKSSASYQRWLTPEEFGQYFGPADADITAVSDWLQSEGFQINSVSAGRTVIEFSGTAGQVKSAFHTAIHQFVVDGKEHLANASDPQIPAALSPVVAGLVSLHNFGRKSHSRYLGEFRRSLKTGMTTPLITLPDGSRSFYGVGPADFAKIYNTQTLWNAGIDGTGQTIAIVGETNIDISDVQAFRTVFGLPSNDPQIILNGEDPGITSTHEEAEADLDVQWSGAVAKNATIKFVVSASTPASAGVDLSALYIIEHNLAGVMSESYGECESALGTAGNQFYNSLWQQAAAQGITVLLSSGDGGSAGCDNFNTATTASQGIAVSGFASTPYNVSVGGTDFDQVNTWSQYWNATNDPTTQLSVKSYIPEIPWNENCAQLGITKCGSGAPDGSLNIVAASGGPSTIYAKPAWQMGVTGMPNDNHRDQPDISLFASPGFDGSGYMYCQKDRDGDTNSCEIQNNNYFDFHSIGGTSAAAPSFAGIMALVNHYQSVHGGNSRQGNANFVLYALAKKSGSSCISTVSPATTCNFYDVTKGNSAITGGIGSISVPCAGGSPDCSVKTAGTNGVLVDPANVNTEAWTATTGYDMATGLGSVNAANLAANWASVSTVGTSTTLTLNPTTGITHGTENVSVSSTVTPASGSSSPTGIITLIATKQDGTQLALDSFLLSNGSISNQKAKSLPGGTYNVAAHYSGDGTFAPSDSAVTTVTVGQEGSQTFVIIPIFDPQTGAQINGNASTFPYGSSAIIRAYVTNSTAAGSASGPPSPVCAAVNQLTCPTGTVTMTDNGAPLDAGIYSLNNQGYTRDLNPIPVGGNHTLVAKYSGDNSYTGSNTTISFTVTPAAMQANTVVTYSSGQTNNEVDFDAQIDSSALNGVAPTGTVKFFEGANQLSGTVTLSPAAGNGSLSARLGASIATTFTTNGVHSITAQYSGDNNYAAATSAPVNVTLVYPTTMSVSVDSSNILLGQSVNVTAKLTTGKNSPAITGQFAVYGSSTQIPSPITPTLSTDGSGNQVLTATFTTSPQSSESVQVAYQGDSNYGSSNDTKFVTVNIPDFSLSALSTPLTITAGQSGATQITITPASNNASSVSLSCNNLTVPFGYSCAFQPATVSLANGASAISTLTFTPGPTSNVIPAHAAASKRAGFVPFGESSGWLLSLLSGGAALFFLAWPCRRKRLRTILGLGFLCLLSTILSVMIGCGGGGSGNPPPPPVPTPTTTTMATSAPSIAANTPVIFTATVSGTRNPTGQVDFYVNGNFYASATMQGNTASLSTLLSTPGIYMVYAKYDGDANNLTSKSSNVGQAVTGPISVQVNGQTSTVTHSVNLAVTIQ